MKPCRSPIASAALAELLQRTFAVDVLWISDPSCHLAEPRIVGVVEGEQEGGAMPAPAEGPAQGGAAEAIYDRRWG